MAKHSIYSILAVLLATLMLFACSDDSEDKNTNADGDTEENAETSEAADKDGEITEGEVQKIKLPFEPASKDFAPDPMARGPFPVGVKTYEFTNEKFVYPETGKARYLKIEVWYPAKQKHKDDESFSYDLKAEAKGQDLGKDKNEKLQTIDVPKIPSTSIRDAEIDISNGPYPMIVFSHGANGIRWQSTFYTEHLASHGYVVISADHEMNTTWDIIRDGYNAGSVLQSIPQRIEDVPFMIDRFLEFNNDSEHFFSKSINEDKIGISGHSLGGVTSLAVPCADSRIKASVPHSPLMCVIPLFNCPQLSEYLVPTMVMGGTDDKTLKWKDMYCDYEILDGVEKYLYELEKGGHFTFSIMCDLDLFTLAHEFGIHDADNALTDGCSKTDNVDWNIAYDSINHYATAFFNKILRDSEDSKKYLVEKSGGVFDPVNFYIGKDLPKWSGTGEDACGCSF